MKLVIFNGSPRSRKSNSALLIHHFLRGYDRIDADAVDVHYLAEIKQKEQQIRGFENADIILVFFPLYTDSMPGIVKEFFESIFPLKSAKRKKIGFFVQSGFPETIHSVYLARYLEKFAGRLNAEYLGTVIKGGVEGIQVMPPWMTRKLFSRFGELGEYFAEHRAFSPAIMETLAKPYLMSPLRRFVFRLMIMTGLSNFYWNSNLKKNGAFENRFDQPFKAESAKEPIAV